MCILAGIVGLVLIAVFWGFIRFLMTAPGNMPDADSFVKQAEKLRGKK